jgi:hypothetical protein
MVSNKALRYIISKPCFIQIKENYYLAKELIYYQVNKIIAYIQ